MGKGGGSPQPTSQNVVQTNLPEYVRPYFERLLQRTEAASKEDYIPYEGDRLAGFSEDQLASQDMMRQIAGSGIAGLDQAQSATGSGIDRALQGMGYRSEDFDAAQAQKYMDPYMQQVVDVQKERAILDAQRQGADRAAQAVQQGAFGGSRAAVQEGLAGEALSRQLAEIQASGQQQAFAQAQEQFERDRASRESAERLGLSAAGMASDQAAQLAQLGKLAREGDIQAASLLKSIGQEQQRLDQAGLDIAYQDFVRQRDYPKEMLNFYSSILRGVPVSPSTESTQFQAYNPTQQLLGAGLSAASLYKAFQ